MAITIYLNGKKEDIENGMSIAKLLTVKNIRPEVVTVELNDNIIEKDKFKEIQLKPNDRLEFVYYMGGGGSTQPTFCRLRSPLISRTILSERMK